MVGEHTYKHKKQWESTWKKHETNYTLHTPNPTETTMIGKLAED